jgi:hypothetical protein
LDELNSFVQGLSGKEAKDLVSIQRLIFTDVHLFYDGSKSGQAPVIKLWSEFPTLSDLLELGPSKCLERRLRFFSKERLKKISRPKPPKAPAKSQQPNAEVIPLAPPSIEITLAGEDYNPDRPLDHQQDKPTPSIPQIMSASLEANVTQNSTSSSSSDNGLAISNSAIHENSTTNQTALAAAHNSRIPPSNEINQLGAATTKRRSSVQSNDSESDEYTLLIKDLNRRYRKRNVDTASFFTPVELRRDSVDGYSTASSLADDTEAWPGKSSNPIEDDTVSNRTRDQASQLGTEQKMAKYDPDFYRLQMKQKIRTENLGLPSASGIKFRWIHIPANNMVWVPAIFQAIAKELNEPSLHKALLHRKVWNARQHVARHDAPHGRFMMPCCQSILPKMASPVMGSVPGLTSPVDTSQLSIFFPYLHWDTFENLKARRSLVEKRLNQDRPYPVDKGLSNDCIEHQLIWWYCRNFAELPIHVRRSLDQYGYPNLANTKARDLDQILYKRTRPKSTPTGKKAFNSEERRGRDKTVSDGQETTPDRWESRVLMVDQLW